MPDLMERIAAIASKYEQLSERMNAPESYGDPGLYAKLAKEQRELAPLAEAWQRRGRLERELREAEELQRDPELRELARDEAEQARLALAENLEELKRLLLPKDPNDDRSVILEIRAGVGGEEAALFAADLYRMYAMYAEKRGWRLETADAHATELGGFKEICCTVEGEGVWSRLKYEAGSHCVKRVPATEASGRIQTSTATVAVLPEIGETEFTLNPAELKIDTFRSSGAGGQKVNKTETAIRVTHLPTGTVVECQDERSQYKNKDRALRILRARLYEAEQARQGAEVAAARRGMVGTGERSEKIRTYFFLRNQAVDQRLSGESRAFSLPELLNGNLDGLIDALAAADRAERLKAQKQEGTEA